MEMRLACSRDIPGMIDLLLQVGEVHHKIRPDLFRAGAQKYDEAALAELLRDPNRPIFAAVEAAKAKNPDAEVVLMTPKGKIWEQSDAVRYAESGKNYIFICPHYEGYDERILTLVDHQLSVGKFILTGGELPTMTVIDSIVRLIPGVLGGEQSAEIESFSDGDNYEYPQYTKPAEFRGLKVPEVLLSGNHGAIATWRAENAPNKPAED